MAEELKLKGLTNRTEFYQKDLPTFEKSLINADPTRESKRCAQDRLRKDLVSAQITAKGGDLMFKYVENDEHSDKNEETVTQVKLVKLTLSFQTRSTCW